MGSIVYNYADVMVATDDDPDTENRIKILSHLTDLIRDKESDKKDLFIIPERYLAMKFACDIAQT
jgi:UDP-N-acetylmuramyl tripeptide synthase